MTYATYEDYTEKYLKGRAEVIPKSDFKFWADRASLIIDQFTFNRLKNSEQIPDEVILATCALAESVYKSETEKVLTSESVGNWSGSYAVNNHTPQEEYSSLLKMYLGNTGLLYRGGCR